MPIGRVLLILGLIMVILGAVLTWAPGLLRWFGKLPGDVSLEKGGTSFYFPVVSMIIISIILSILLNLISRR